MIAPLARNWWLLALRGIAGILLGMTACVWPGLTLEVLVLLSGVYVLVAGAFALVAGIHMRRQMDRWWRLVLQGVAETIPAVLTFLSPGVTVLVLLASMAAWSITTRVFERTTAVRLRTAIDNDRLLLVSSVISMIYGVLLRIVLDAGALALVWLSGAYALLVGTLTLALAVRLPGLHRAMGNPAPGGVSAPTSSPIEVCYAAPLPTLCHP